MDVIGTLKRGCTPKTTIAYPEATDERILKAAELVVKESVGTPLLVGNPAEIEKAAKSFGASLTGMRVVDSSKVPKAYVDEYVKVRGKSAELAEHLLRDPLYHAVMAVRLGDADTMLGGAVYTSADMICACVHVLGLEKGISTPSSVFIMDTPGYSGGENGVLLFSDCSANISPCPEALADIAITTARTARELLGWEPRVAMLSFSTKGSAADPLADKVVEAVKIARKKAPALKIDGEMQGDTALNPTIAAKKIKGGVGPVAGKANVLIFPDINAGNICYKLAQELAKTKAYGPILQGFKRPVSDLSRGATPEAILGTSIIVSAWAGRKARK
jgi:phosphate acetyltransferase